MFVFQSCEKPEKLLIIRRPILKHGDAVFVPQPPLSIVGTGCIVVYVGHGEIFWELSWWYVNIHHTVGTQAVVANEILTGILAQKSNVSRKLGFVPRIGAKRISLGLINLELI